LQSLVCHSFVYPSCTGGFRARAEYPSRSRLRPLLPAERRKPMAERYEYKVVEVRESLVGGKMSGGKLEKLLNDYASQGWQLKAITSADVKGRVGPGGTEGLLVTFERRIG
jgi:hypothetical protein